jgi:hypothetical protein
LAWLAAAAKKAAASSTVPWAAFIAAVSALTVALLNVLYSQWSSRVDRRRNLYSEAYKAAMAWVEMVYRVRRRSSDSEDDLVERFHDLQENIAFHEGWLATESPELARSYCKLIDAVRERASPLIRSAWSEDPRPRSQPSDDGDEHPDVQAARDAFLLDAQEHLSFWPWIRNRVKTRNPKETTSNATR